MASKLLHFIAELQRRRVVHVAGIYVAAALAVWGAADFAFPALGLDDSAGLLVLLLTAIGFPVALVLAWIFRASPDLSTPTTASSETPFESSKSGGRKSIIVLPFDNMSPDPGDAYFSDGLTEEIITHLSYIGSLRVISRNSAMVLKGTQKDTRTIGNELDVQYVLEGSVRKAGSDLRITAQLIDAISDEHLWAEKYDGNLDDVFSIQETVSHSIAERLKLSLSPKENRLLSARPIRNLPAYECYLRARQDIWEGTPERLDKAVHDLMIALDLVGENALILAGLGYASFQKANFGHGQDEAVKESGQYALRALELDPDCAEAEVVLGASTQSFFGDQRASIRHLERARRLDPNNPDAVVWLLNADLLVGRGDQARDLAEVLVELDPLNALSHALKGLMLWHEGRFDSAVDSCAQAYEMAPDSPPIVMIYSTSLARAGRMEEFQRVHEHGLPPDSAMIRLALQHQAAAEGDRERVFELLSDDLERTGRRDCQFSYLMAGIQSQIGEIDGALSWLDSAVESGFVNYPVIARVDPLLENLREDPRFRELLDRVEPEWESYKA